MVIRYSAKSQGKGKCAGRPAGRDYAKEGSLNLPQDAHEKLKKNVMLLPLAEEEAQKHSCQHVQYTFTYIYINQSISLSR